MNKIYTIIISALCLFSITLEARTLQEASAIASAFIQLRGEAAPAKRMQRAAAATTITIPVELAFTQHQVDTTTPAVYVFNSTNKGFVLVSAEDNARAILGYSDQDTFDANNIPENMQFWLQMYADEMGRLGEEAMKRGAEEAKKAMKRKVIGDEAMRREASAETYPTISPILGETIWGQGKPFNNKCPEINGEHTAAGCVATALSQIMYAHKYPTKGTGSHSYTTESKGLKVSADFGNTTYDWANMIPDYNSSYTTAQANAVATLMYQVGVAADMDYTVDASGAVSSIALTALTKYFGYDKAIHVLPKDFMTEESLLQAIVSDLQAGRPVYVSGATVNKEGHAFVCDGMKSDGYLHINWGWYGMANGYFAISALNPEVQGTGGSASNLAFTEGVGVYTNIKPNEGGKAMPLATVNKLTRVSADAISKTTEVCFSLDNLTSTGITSAKGTISYFLYNSNQTLIQTVNIWDEFELDPGYYYTTPIELSSTLPYNLAEGNYELEIRYTDAADIDHPILVKGLGEVRIPFTVTSTQFIFGATPKPETEPRKICNADFSNVYGSNIWKIDLFSSLFWDDAASDKDILISCYVYSDSETSVAGTYILDTTNSGGVGTIDNGAEYCIGYYNSCYSYTPTDLHLTIVPGANGEMMIQYYMEVDGDTMNYSFSTKPDWYSYDNNKDVYTYLNTFTYELAASLKASKALALTEGFNHSNITEMSYFVKGIISNLRNTPEQIAQYKNASFDISDDSTSYNQFYCHNTKWLGNTDFAIGNEIKSGDIVVLLGRLHNDQYDIPEIRGYIYSHNGTTTVNKQQIAIDSTYEVYDLMGRAYRSTENLQPGIYIMQTGTTTTKVYINQ